MATIIKDIQRNNNEIIRIEVSEFKGHELINIRIWYRAIDPGGDVVFKPTQKGVTLNIAEYGELKDGIEKIGVFIRDMETGSSPEQPFEHKNGTSDNGEDEVNEKEEDE